MPNTNRQYQTLKEIVDFYEADVSRMPYGITVLRMCLDHSTGKMDDPEYIEVMKEQQQVKAALTEELKDFDACVMMSGTSVMHFVGFPSIALHMCYDGKWPYGAILFAPDEKKLLAAALTLEKYAKPIPMPELTDEIKKAKAEGTEVAKVMEYCRTNMEVLIKEVLNNDQ